MIRVRIEDYPGYFAQSDGNIYSCKTNKVICKWIDNTGYFQVVLYKNKKRCHVRVHRVIAEIFVKNPNNLPMVNHKDADKRNNLPNNLEWVNNKENTQHGYDKGVYPKTRCVPVVAINKETFEQLQFDSIRQCAEQLKINRKTLSSIIKCNKPNNSNYEFYLIS